MRRPTSRLLSAAIITSVVTMISAAPAAADSADAGPGVIFRSADGMVVRTIDGVRTTVLDRPRIHDLQYATLSLSPDGEAFSYVTNDGELRVREASGIDRRLGPVGSLTSWSPDSRQLIFNGPNGVYLSERSGGTRVLIDDSTAIAYRWSPAAGSRTIAVRITGAHGIGLYDVDSGQTTRLVEGDAWFNGWSPSGDRIAYVERETDQLNVVAARAGAEPRTYPYTTDGYSSWVWSPDGQKLAGWQERTVTDPLLASRTVYDAQIVDLESGTRRMIRVGLDDPAYTIMSPDWGPTNEQMLINFRDQPSLSGGNLFALDLASGRLNQLTVSRSAAGFTYQPRLSEAWFPNQPQSRSIDHACQSENTGHRFPDVTSSNVHYEAISCIAHWQITEGRTDGTYGPQGTVTRAQMASFIARMIERSGATLPAPSSSPFTDVSGPHASNINKLAAAGIVRGTGTRTYSPERTITRAQMATFLNNAYEYRTGATIESDRIYFSGVAGPHADNIQAVAYAGITAGTSSGGYNPNGQVKRDQMASFLARTLDVLVAGGHTTRPAP